MRTSYIDDYDFITLKCGVKYYIMGRLKKRLKFNKVRADYKVTNFL